MTPAVTILMTICSVVAVGLFSNWFSEKYSLPGGRIVLTVFIVGTINLLGGGIDVPTWLQLPGALVVGTMFGMRLEKENLSRITRVLPAAIVVVLWYVGITWLYAWVLQGVADLETSTALVSVLPGGITEASLIASGFGADRAIVATFQMARFVAIITAIPILGGPLRRFFVSGVDNGETPDPDGLSSTTRLSAIGKSKPASDNATKPAAVRWVGWILPLGSSALVAVPLVAIGFPAGVLLGPLVFIGVVNSTGFWKPAPPPQWLYKSAQVAIGTVVGSAFTQERAAEFSRLLLPTLTLAILVIGTSFLLGAILAKIYKWPVIAGFLAVVPGGLTPVAIMAADLGLDVASISLLQLVRILTAILVIPTTYSWFF